jgi:hypothetical protein
LGSEKKTPKRKSNSKGSKTTPKNTKTKKGKQIDLAEENNKGNE